MLTATGTGASAYTSDADGNTLTGGGRTNTWDSQNRLVSCVYNGTTSTFTYGADGLRRSATVGGITTYYVYDGQTLVREMMKNAQGAFYNTATYLQGPRGSECRIDETQQTEGYYNPADAAPRSVHARGVTKWYVYDGLGSVVAEVDPNGTLTSSPKYDVYGLVRGNSGTASSKMGFVGGLGHLSEANTGLIYMKARYYDPGNGRFESEDPGYSGMNWFVYCNDNPINLYDASGRNGIAIAFAIEVIEDMLKAFGWKPSEKMENFLNSVAASSTVMELANMTVEYAFQATEAGEAGKTAEEWKAGGYMLAAAGCTTVVGLYAMEQMLMLFIMSDDEGKDSSGGSEADK